jgi:NarL family two-component system response regulator LiaR
MSDAPGSANQGKSKDGNTEEAPVRVVIADDDPFARRVIKDVLQQAGITVIAEARNGRQAVELALYYRPDIVLMDVVMPELDGIIATRQILKQLPDIVVIVLTSAGDEDDELGIQALRAGAQGFLSKDVDIDALPRALAATRQGEPAISRRMTKTLVEHLRQAPSGATGMRPVKSPLTAREWEVIDLLQGGRSTEDVAEMLVVSPETVRSHIKNILRKLNVRSREEAVLAAEKMRSAPPG